MQIKADNSNVHVFKTLTKLKTEKVFTKEIDEILLLNTTSTEEMYGVKPKLIIENNDTAQILNTLNESRVVKDGVVQYDILEIKL